MSSADYISRNYNQWAQSSSSRFPDPFLDIASLYFPSDIKQALWWCERLALKNGPLTEALHRIVAYFITEIEVYSPTGDAEERVGREEKEKYLSFLHDVLGINDILLRVGLDYLIYGNSFTSMLRGFDRYLICTNEQCNAEYRLEVVLDNPESFAYEWTDFSFHIRCPRCGAQGEAKVKDRDSEREDRIRVRRWNPFLIEIDHNTLTGHSEYFMNIDPQDAASIRRGEYLHLLHTPLEVIESVKLNVPLRLDERYLHHIRDETFAGLSGRGWGVPKIMTIFSQAFYVQLLMRANEGFALDWVTPLRVISPVPQTAPGGSGALGNSNARFMSRIGAIVRMHRRDPTRWYVVPEPLDYKLLGGEATSLAPVELIDHGMDMVLNALGIPVQLYKGDLTLQQAPAAMRLMEARWSGLVYQLNKFLNWLCMRVADVLQWEPVKVRLQKTQHADDINRQMARLQLMQAGLISRTTGMRSIGLDAMEEERRKLEEERIMAEEAQQMQQELEQAAQMDAIYSPPPIQPPMDPSAMGMGASPAGPAPGGAPTGGAPPAGQMPTGPMPAAGGPIDQLAMQLGIDNPQLPQSPEQWQSYAAQLASQLKAYPYEIRKSLLLRLKQRNETLHALVVREMEKLDQQNALIAKQQQQTAPPPPGGMPMM